MPLDRAERWEEQQAAIEQGLDSLQARLFTMLPVKVTSIEHLADQNIISVQPLIKQRVRVLDKESGLLQWKDQSWPEFTKVPVKFPSGGGWTTTYPVKVGDEGTIHVSQRCIDNWWSKGGEQPQQTADGLGSLRMHNPSDGFFLLGGRSKPNALSNVSADHVETRSDDGRMFFRFGADGVTIGFDGEPVFSIDASGNVKAKGEIERGAFGGNPHVKLGTHVHDGVMSGGNDTTEPVDGT